MNSAVNGELVPIGGGDSFPLVRDRLTIGRRDVCDIYLPFPNISGQHCELSFRDGYWHIRDLGSTNGIKINGLRVQTKLLRPGDEIGIAKKRYRIEYTPAAGAPSIDELEEEEDIMNQSLLEKAGLVRPPRKKEEPPKSPLSQPGVFSAQEDEESEE